VYLLEALDMCVNETILNLLPASKRHQHPDVPNLPFRILPWINTSLLRIIESLENANRC